MLRWSASAQCSPPSCCPHAATSAGMVWKCSMAMFLLALMVHGAHPWQPSPAPHKTSWHHEEHALNNDFSVSWKNLALHGKAETEANEQTRLAPVRQVGKSTQDLLGVCDCFVSHSARRTGCSYEIGEYGPLIINGTCFNGTQRKRRRRQSAVFTNNAPIEFADLPWCEGFLPLLLVSSGEKKTLHLSNVPSVWVCPLSLGAPLQELSITDVPEVRIAPGALAHRLTDFTFKVTGVFKALDVPREAFSVDTEEVENVDDPLAIESSVEDSLLPQVKILVVNASSVRFDSMSVSAPRVWVEVRQTETLVMETNAVKALSFSLDSALKVSFTQKFLMGTRAATVKRLWVTNTSKLLLREESIEVTVPGGEVVLNQVDVMLPERSIIVGDGARLELINVSLTTLGHRAVYSSSPLSFSLLMSVAVTGPAPTPICLATRHLILKNMTSAMGEHSTTSACFRFSHTLEVDKRERAPGVVLSKTSSLGLFSDPHLFSDPRCALCNPQPTVVIESTPPPILLRTTASAPPETPHSGPTNTGPTQPGTTNTGPTQPGPTNTGPTQPNPTHRIHTHPVTTHESEVSNGTEQSWDVESNWWEEPKYLGPAAALALLVILLLLFCCLCRLHKRSKRAKYELPQTFRSRTFPRTIVTPDTLDASPPGPPLHTAPVSHAPAELFVSYHVSHGPSLHQAAVAQHQRWQNGRAPADPNTAYWRENHHPSSRHNGSLMAPEDDCSISSSEMTI